MNTNKALTKHCDPNQQPPTPSLTKRKRAQEKKLFRSPTDSMLSPCSQRLMKPKHASPTDRASPSVQAYREELVHKYATEMDNLSMLQNSKITAQQAHELTLDDKENNINTQEQRLSFGRNDN